MTTASPELKAMLHSCGLIRYPPEQYLRESNLVPEVHMPWTDQQKQAARERWLQRLERRA